jgi:hypothetical protein
MKSPDAGSNEPMDDLDFAILDGIRAIFGRADPVPADLPERIKFSLALRDLEAEVACLAAEEEPQLVATRGAEQSRTVTFDSTSLTIMIRIDPSKKDTVRIDGWLAPPQRREIELRTPAETLCASSDEQGRFAFADVPHGTARLVVRAVEHDQGEHDQGGTGSSVVTPALVL